jgi:hypothetical protein
VLSFLLNNIALAGFNLVNSRIDAHRILRYKNIYHGINLGAYLTLTGFLIWCQHPESGSEIAEAVNFLFSAFFNRQLSFDIPLNLRRGLKWDYQSTDPKPKAIMDRAERWLFGNLEGKYIAAIYAAGFVLCAIKNLIYVNT